MCVLIVLNAFESCEFGLHSIKRRVCQVPPPPQVRKPLRDRCEIRTRSDILIRLRDRITRSHYEIALRDLIILAFLNITSIICIYKNNIILYEIWVGAGLALSTRSCYNKQAFIKLLCTTITRSSSMRMTLILMRNRTTNMMHEICTRMTTMHVMGKTTRVLHIAIMHDRILTQRTGVS